MAKMERGYDIKKVHVQHELKQIHAEPKEIQRGHVDMAAAA